MILGKALGLQALRHRPLPDDFIPEIPWPEHGVHQELEVVTRGWIAMQVDTRRLFHHTAEFDQPRRHH